MSKKYSVILRLDNNNEAANTLKKLALVFDKIYFDLTSFRVFTNEYVNSDKIKLENKKTVFYDFDFFRDTHYAIRTMIKNFNTEAKELIEAFIEEGIMEFIEDKKTIENERYKYVKNLIIGSTLDNQELLDITDTKQEQLMLKNIVQKNIFEDSDGNEFKIWGAQDPNIVFVANEIIDISFLASGYEAMPLFLDMAYQEVLKYQYRVIKLNQNLLYDLMKDKYDKLNESAKLGKFYYTIVNSIISSESLKELNIKETLKLRNALNKSRIHFLSESTIHLLNIIEEEPWSKKIEQEVNKYIKLEIEKNIFSFEEESKQIYEKLYGRLVINSSEILKSSIIGGGASGLIGSIIPQTNIYELMLLGLIVGSVKELPNLTKDLVETFLDIKKRKRSSISYVAKLNEL